MPHSPSRQGLYCWALHSDGIFDYPAKPMQTNTVVIGASAAGLATAGCLAQAGVDHVVLEQRAQVGTAWRNHYERLHLHTTRDLSGLPHLPMPAHFPRYPAREQVVEYLEGYAARLGISPHFGEAAVSVRRENGTWKTETEKEEYTSENVVVATGYTRIPHLPSWPGQGQFLGDLIHSSQYKNGDAYRGKNVLVVGFGNSGGEIAIDLAERGAFPTIAVRSPVNVVPRDFLGVPILAVGIVMGAVPTKIADAMVKPLVAGVVGDIEKLGLRKLPYGPNEQIREHGRIPLLDIGTIDLIRQGKIEVAPGVRRFTETGAIFEDDTERRFAGIVLATGYRPKLSEFLHDAHQVTDELGVPTKSGHETLPGLYFCGFYVSPTGMLREIGIEAARIAERIAN